MTVSSSSVVERKIIDIYARISNDDEVTDRRVDVQVELGHADITDLAHEGYEVGKVFKDPARSAWKPTDRARRHQALRRDQGDRPVTPARRP